MPWLWLLCDTPKPCLCCSLPTDLHASPLFLMSACSGLWAHLAEPPFPLSSSDLCLKPGTSTTSSRKPSLSTQAQRAWDKCQSCSCGPLSSPLPLTSPAPINAFLTTSPTSPALLEAQAPEGSSQTSSPLLPASSPTPSGEWLFAVGADDQQWEVDGRVQTQPGPCRQRQAASE